MKFFIKKAKEDKDETSRLLSEGDIKLKDTKKLLDELTQECNAGVTRPDYLQVMVEALVRLHPEIKDDSEVIAFWKKLADYRAKPNSRNGE